MFTEVVRKSEKGSTVGIVHTLRWQQLQCSHLTPLFQLSILNLRRWEQSLQIWDTLHQWMIHVTEVHLCCAMPFPMYPSKGRTLAAYFVLTETLWTGSSYIFILHIRRRGHRKVKHLGPGLAASKCQCKAVSSGNLSVAQETGAPIFPPWTHL